MKNKKLAIIAGPCSLDKRNEEQIHQIAEIKIDKNPCIFGVRIVGLKSRTKFNEEDFMGIDASTFQKNLQIIMKGGSEKDLKIPPSYLVAEKFVKKHNLLVATEIMSPILQLPFYKKTLFKNKFLAWNPSSNQLGWPLKITSEMAKKYGWYIGIKNGKWISESIDQAWIGLSSYSENDKSFLIHRGFEDKTKENYRNFPRHDIAKSVKNNTKLKLFFDPSHSLGPKLKENIVEETVKAMKMKITEDEYLYDGILIEVGDSQTDTNQHISISELKEMIYKIQEIDRNFY